MAKHEIDVSSDSADQLMKPEPLVLQKEVEYLADINGGITPEIQPLSFRERLARRRQEASTPTAFPSTDIDLASDATEHYFSEAGQFKLLHPKKEHELTVLVQKGINAKGKLQDTEEVNEKADLEQIVRKGAEAKEQLVNSNLRLVISIAKNYLWSGIPLLDLVQEGNIGLMHAIDCFDPDRGFRLSTYATHWIRQSITRSIQNDARTIRIPVHMDDALKRYSKAVTKFTMENNREPDQKELDRIIEEVSGNPNTFKEIRRTTALLPASMDKPFMLSNDGVSFAEILPDQTENTEDEAIENVYQAKLKEAIDDELVRLTPREREVIRLRFGLAEELKMNRRGNYTLEEIATRMNVSREWVRQIESEALSKL